MRADFRKISDAMLNGAGFVFGAAFAFRILAWSMGL